MQAISKNDVRPAAVAGLFYPKNPQTLNRDLERMLTEAHSVTVKGEITALISPHAGYVYSGCVAAEGYKQLENCECPVIALIAPSHREAFDGVSVFNGKGYETPLGLVKVDADLADALIAESENIVPSWAGHKDEHAIEVQLPFLQKVLKNVSIIPIVMGSQDYDTCELLGKALAKVLRDKPSVVVASSDLSHYHPYEEANRIDGLTIEIIESFDEKGLAQAFSGHSIEACGAGAIIATMTACKCNGADTIKILRYMNSGDTSGDLKTVVGYLAAAIYKTR